MEDTSRRLAAVKAIQKKLLGKRLSYDEIFTIMDEISSERLGDVLTTYFVAAGFKEGFSPVELYYMTKAMVDTGTRLQFEGIVADKHSTGGLAGTRTTMIVVPIIAAAGYKIPKTSSRAITTPAGTADVMELLSEVTFPPEKIKQIVEEVGGCIVWGGKLGIAPADDVIIHVEEPLSFESFDKIIVSIMAKKIAVGTNHLILDLPFGKTMKIRHRRDAQLVAQKFMRIGRYFHMEIVPYINRAKGPAGFGVGPYLEAVDVLKVLENSPDRAVELEKKAVTIAGTLLQAIYRTEKKNLDGLVVAQEILSSGKALAKFRQIVAAQGGSPLVSSDSLKKPKYRIEIPHAESGTINEINNYNLNAIAKTLGAPADRYAGVRLHSRIGERVTRHDISLTLYSSTRKLLQEAEDMIDHFPVFYYNK
ncbi:MAG: thymidine phosphorylase [Patescibacteria group bacterium]|nr:thymidine phosphorylase [Patescibacteria group bacterium]